jgi:hypothetical protein
MVDAVQPRTRVVEDRSGESAGKRLLTGTLRACGRRLLWAAQELWCRREESWRRRAAIVVRKYAHLVPPRSGGDHDV